MGGRGRVTSPASVLSLHARGESTVEARTYPGRSPVLVLAVAGTQLTLATADAAQVSAADVAFARCLAEQAHAFAAACERMYRGVRAGSEVRR